MADVDVSVEAAGAVDTSVDVASEPAPEAEPAVAAGPSVEMPWTADSVGEASKGELVTFLQANCSAEFLSKHKLKGQAKAITKKAKAPALQEAYKEVLDDPSVLVSKDTKAAEDEAAAKENAAKEAAAAAAAAEKAAAAAAEAAAAAAKGKEKKGFKKRTTSKAPSGAKTPKVGENVQVMYKGTLEDGYVDTLLLCASGYNGYPPARPWCSLLRYCRTVFDQSQGWNAETRKKWKPLQFKVGQGRVIRGWVRRLCFFGFPVCLAACQPLWRSLAAAR
jgi:FKBP-type peptidyl-prolyl cis-trans isomerase